MANIDLDWEVEGLISPEESVTKTLQVIASKTKADSGTFWCWDGRVSGPIEIHAAVPFDGHC